MDDDTMLQQIKFYLNAEMTHQYLIAEERGMMFQWLDTIVAERKFRHTHNIVYDHRRDVIPGHSITLGDLDLITDHVLATMEARYVVSRRAEKP